MKVSIIVPTYGSRLDYLADTLRTVKNQNFPIEDYEILVIDNNPKSQVTSVVDKINQEVKEGPIIVRIPEPEIGLSRARNTGALKAHGEVIVYVGDDILAHPEWLKALVRPFEDARVGCSGGKLIAKWEAPIPEWIGQVSHMALGMLDLGDQTLELTGQQVWGDNMAVRKTALLEVGGFNPDIYGYADKNYLWLGGDGEHGLEEKVYKRNYKFIYEPQAWLYHRVPASRTKEDYFYKRNFVGGIGCSFGQIRNMPNKNFLSVRLLVQSAYYFLKSGKWFLTRWLDRKNHIRAGTYANFYQAKAQHQWRVALNKKLRAYVLQESYL